jgi:hypothetical protein
MINFIAGIFTDVILISLIGMMFIGIYAVFYAYFSIMADKYAFAKFEILWDELKNDLDLGKLLFGLFHINEIENPKSVIPSNPRATLFNLVNFYFINLFIYIIMIEIFYLAVVQSIGGIVFTKETEIFLPVIVAAIPIGARVGMMLDYHHAKQYGSMITEVIFVFMLIGVIGSLFDSGGPTSGIQNFVNSESFGRFLALCAYLAILPIILELSYWMYIKHISNDETDT